MRIKELKEAIANYSDDLDVMIVMKSDDIAEDDKLIWLKLDMQIQVLQGSKQTIAFCNNTNLGIKTNHNEQR